MLVDIVTIFPGFFASPLATGLLGKAGERGLVEAVPGLLGPEGSGEPQRGAPVDRD